MDNGMLDIKDFLFEEIERDTIYLQDVISVTENKALIEITRRLMGEILQDFVKLLKREENYKPYRFSAASGCFYWCDERDEVLDKEVLDIKVPEKKKKVFTPPTLEEVEAYVVEKNLPVSAKEFWEYFEAGNWKDAKGNQVKNWKQKILTWSHYRKDNQETKDEEFFKVEW